ncbi:PREDICTED: uncharacterized protein LOC104585627 [Nelumbo nucifera]|uniref:Uncharacterized protein LOC104585627 n=1 Tax=Nelumbo nucifera TaxID=4432 RepID=A0A1U7YT95_NELNU|nr:PREDICTED: uncharacterized protein LOC104585627 [Nelumbo nucifera]XP_010240883.1 PREDICTED: uncharacterized protein LOC104585627 [Nelumbo nucifera]XP_010240891.1 PREDICTED: uncharacterized protein LOC104585627 [Nelumbo nucifera]XP_010240900.1 PREDICTED: uncharacterized protein LOC104585627 [Nelumbo nucifera]XP_010240904.1 PREDICTED: uncharacterized protein LOC104585627 [Nelumbo nucifera]
MDCNKEEAIRAKVIAEKKMQTKDFMGARKIALRAQQLYPDLENISQLLTVCEVHCSAEQRIFGSEMDWYAILQVEQTADEASIKKQYRKLALLLHPDKNKFSGAEAAFKLIGEAQRVLSDQAKRSAYDMKRRNSMRTVVVPKQPQPQASRNSSVRKQPGAQSNFVNVAPPQFTSTQYQQQQQQGQPVFSNGRQTFWTMCPSCGVKYQYFTETLNKYLNCPKCTKPFIARQLDAQGVPTSNWYRPVFPQQKVAPGQAVHNVGPQSTAWNPPCSMGFQGNSNYGISTSEKVPRTGGTSEAGEKSKTTSKEDGGVDRGVGDERAKRPEFVQQKTGDLKHSGSQNRKRGRKITEESSESCDSGSSIDTEEVMEDGLSSPQNGATEGHYPRRSTRQKTKVTYNEDTSDDDDFVPSTKRSRGTSDEQSKETSLEEEASKTNKQAGFVSDSKEVEKEEPPLGENLANGKDRAKECKENGKVPVHDVREKSKADDSKSKTSHETQLEPGFFDCPDAEFSDFDKNRKEDSFAVDQVWAIYDDVDGMPRFYARVGKVFSPGFKLRITWLEPDPDDKDEIDWADEELPVACGKFRLGSSEFAEDMPMFSHLASWEKGRAKGSYMIYPRKGETWALFKNWSINWKSEPDNHRKYEYEFVEVLSEYDKEAGITVEFIGKVKGFVCLFQRTTKEGVGSFQILPNELFRFSHKVPSFRMTGKERKDVPEGSFELDPASLPTDLEKYACPEDVKVEVENADAKVKGSCPKSPENKRPLTKRCNMKEESIDQDEKNAPESRNSISSHQSQGGLNDIHTKPSQANAGQCMRKEEIAKHLDSGMGDCCRDGLPPAEVSDSMCQADEEERNSGPRDTNSDSVAEDPSSSPVSSAEPSEIPESDFYDFESEKSHEKFQPGQIWALYSDVDGLPKYYAQIKKIKSPPDFKVYITWLEACEQPKDMIQWLDKEIPICCGTFKVQNGKPTVYDETGFFSHQLRVETSGKNGYNIYPRKGEVWALFKDWNTEWTCSDLLGCKYDIVEILEDNALGIKVLLLVQVDGYKSVYKAKRKGASAVTMEIPRVELLRFSHQIPAHQLTEERDGRLRGCWELDPAAMPS